MAKNIYCQTLYGNPVLSGVVSLSFGPTFEQSVKVLETTLTGAALHSAFTGGPYGSVFQSAAVDELIGLCFVRQASEQLFLRLDGATIPGVTLSDPVSAGSVIRSTEDISVASYIAGVATGVAIAQ